MATQRGRAPTRRGPRTNTKAKRIAAAHPTAHRPDSRVIPAEITTMIGEACVESYSLHVEESKVLVGSLISKIAPSHNIIHLMSVSHNFRIGIEKGLRSRFNGHISVPFTLIDELEPSLRQKNLAWMIPETTSFALIAIYQYSYHAGASAIKIDDSRVSRNEATIEAYANLKHVDLICPLFASNFDGNTYELNQWMDRGTAARDVRYDACEDFVRALIKDSALYTTGLTVKFLIEDAPKYSNVAAYSNFEVLIRNGGSWYIKVYETTALNWNIRIRREHNEAEQSQNAENTDNEADYVDLDIDQREGEDEEHSDLGEKDDEDYIDEKDGKDE